MPFCCEDKTLRLITHLLHLLIIFIFSVLLLKVFPYGWDYVCCIWFSTAENIGCNMYKGNLQHTLKFSC